MRLLAALLLCAQWACGATRPYVTLAWDASPDTNVIGYHIYWGTNSRTYTAVIEVGLSLTCQAPICSRTNYFAATAYDAWGLESDFSQELCWKPDAIYWSNWFNKFPVVLSIARASVSAPILTSTDLMHWEPSGELAITNPWRWPGPQRFWMNAVLTRKDY